MKKLISLLLIGCLLCVATPVCVAESTESNVTTAYVYLENMKTGIGDSYEAVTKNDTIYMLPEDIAWLGGYEYEVRTVSMDWVKEFFSKTTFLSKIFPSFDIDNAIQEAVFEYAVFSRGSSTPDTITEIYYCNGLAQTMGQSYEVDTVAHNDKTYFNLEKMLYLMHAQWCVEDARLYYYPLDANIFDFINDNFGYMYEHSVQRSDLLMENESKWGHTFRTVVSHIINTVDMRILIPFYGSDMISEEWYKEAMLQLATTDESFLDDAGREQIAKYLVDSSYQPLKTELTLLEGSVDSVVELPTLISESKLNKFSPWNDLADIDTTQLEGMQDGVDFLGDVVTAAQILTDYHEVCTRSAGWSEDFVNGLWVLYAIDEDIYDHGDYIVNASSDLLDEYDHPTIKATEDAVLAVRNWIVGKLVEDTLLGQAVSCIECVVALSNVILKSIPECAAQIEVADLMNTVHALINIENAFLYEFVDIYVDFEHYVQTADGETSSLRLWELMYAPFHESPQTITIRNSISDMRTALEMFLKASLRNKTYVYHFSCFNGGENWEFTPSAQDLRQDIYKTYALLSDLIATRDYDKLLVLDSFDRMYSDEYGCVRTEIKASAIRLNSEPPSKEDAKPVEYNGHHYMVFYDDRIGWHDAKAACEEMGGHLATITSQEENDFVFSLVKGKRVSFWLGATDEENEGDWKWVTNEPWDFNDSLFDNRNDVQHYLVINYNDKQTWDDQSEKDISQNGFLCDTGGYICEWDTTLPEHNGHYYQLFDVEKTWQEAKVYCESLGGHLLTITSQKEQDFVQTLLATGTKNSYWLGAKKSGDFQWITGEPFAYTNWNDEMPDNRNGNEDCLMIYNRQNPWVRNAIGEWNDLKFDGTCNDEEFFGLEDFGFICEWEVAPGTTGGGNDTLSPEWKDLLVDGYWENNIQGPCLYKFFADGTGCGYFLEAGSSIDLDKLVPNQNFTYSIQGDYLSLSGDVNVALKWTSLQENYEWDLGLVNKLPTTESFFYEVEWVDDGSPSSNAFYLTKYRDGADSNVIDASFAKLLGVYQGSYFASQGETGLTLTVYKEGSQCKALFDFYSLPGRTNAESGKYYMDVSYDAATDNFVFTATEWIEKPSMYAFVDLKGSLSGDVLSGETPTKFSVTRTGGNPISAADLREAIVGSWGLQDYIFVSDGSFYFEGDTIQGTYTISDDRTLTIEFPWSSKKYVWSELSFDEFHKDNDYGIYFWCLTSDGVLRLNGTAYYRNGAIPLD